MRRMIFVIGSAWSMLVAGCRPAAPMGELGGRVWTLTELGAQATPAGAGQRPPDIQFDSAAHRAAGFAGCNRFSAPYTQRGDSLSFGPAIATKMFCAAGDAIERAYLAMLDSVTTYRVTDSTLTLQAGGAEIARFRAESSKP